MIETKNKIAIIGLGYVGLPLAVEFSKKYCTIGFDINSKRVAELNSGRDHTLEIDEHFLKSVLASADKTYGLVCTDKLEDIEECDIYIITVPTPIDKFNRPDLFALYKASESVGKVLKNGNVVIYESTVYPGATEEECVPVLEKTSGLKYNHDFFVGYSPERINPGDKEHTVSKILKVTSGSTPETADVIDNLYKSIIKAGTFKASSIKVAEAAKVIENSQRDINIAFINELSKIFNKLNIDTHEVLEAAGTKWNFLKFKPGLVGGHCIGVDPYYLAQKAHEAGYNPEIILAGRRMNDGMGVYIAQEMVKLMIKKEIKISNAKVLVLGFTFKEDCPDVRNTRVIDIVNELLSFNIDVTVFDPWARPEEVLNEYYIKTNNQFESIQGLTYDGIVLAVGHREFLKIDLRLLKKQVSVVYDVKGFFSKAESDKRL